MPLRIIISQLECSRASPWKKRGDEVGDCIKISYPCLDYCMAGDYRLIYPFFALRLAEMQDNG